MLKTGSQTGSSRSDGDGAGQGRAQGGDDVPEALAFCLAAGVGVQIPQLTKPMLADRLVPKGILWRQHGRWEMWQVQSAVVRRPTLA